MKIAFCDDDQYFLSEFNKYVGKISSNITNLDFDEFHSGNSLIHQYELSKNPYDIIFLDIEMEGLNGIETAKKIRMYDENVIIIFSTSHSEYVYESFEVMPFRFIVKPVEFDKFKEVLLAAYSKIKKENRFLFFNVERNVIRLNSNDIYYMESQKRILKISTNNSTYKVYGKLATYENQLYQNDFISVHKSYLVNLNHVIEFNVNSLKVANGDVIPISENRRKYSKEEHIKYILRSYISYDK
jgi:DNA-binding LytR/AlgR family response regulator